MANSEQIASEIQALELRLAALSTQLDAALIPAQQDLAPQAAVWIKRTVDVVIKQHAGVVQTLGIERVREFKRKVNSLLERLPKVIETHTADKAVWPHRVGQGQQPRSDEGYFPSVYRDVISELGAILGEFNLAGDTDARSSNWSVVRGQYRYSINPMFDMKQLPNVGQYQTLLAEYGRLAVERDNKKIDLQRAQARELFDSA